MRDSRRADGTESSGALREEARKEFRNESDRESWAENLREKM